jgi:sulfane dehydrogenase subunit SoxC
MRPVLDPTGFFRRIPLLPHQMSQRITPTEDVIVLCHLGVPRLTIDSWQLKIDGLVDRELQLTWRDLQQFPKVQIESVHQCAGSPLQPNIPTRRITNVVWTGIRLSDVLAQTGIKPQATHMWSAGADYGAFEGVNCDAYVKDIPLSRIQDDVLIAFELNGASLSPEHGFPVRLVVPGYYGTNSVKWLTNITLASKRADGPFTTRWYNDPVFDGQGRPTAESLPVWSIAPESIIVSPSPDANLSRGVAVIVRGWAWACDGLYGIEVSVDNGSSWNTAQLEPSSARGWQAFACDWVPASTGAVEILARATSSDGAQQPLKGRRNEVHRVSVMIV